MGTVVAGVNTETDADFVVVCALEVEREAMCDVLELGDDGRATRNWRRYWRGPVQGDCGTFTVVVAQLPLNANVAAATNTGLSVDCVIMRIIAKLMIGICMHPSRLPPMYVTS